MIINCDLFAEVFNQYGPYKNLTILAVPCCFTGIYLYCKTDSERSVGYFAYFVLYQIVYWSSIDSPKAFDLFAVQSSVLFMVGGMTLGKSHPIGKKFNRSRLGVEGVFATFILNNIMGYILLCEELKHRPHSPDLSVLW